MTARADLLRIVIGWVVGFAVAAAPRKVLGCCAIDLPGDECVLRGLVLGCCSAELVYESHARWLAAVHYWSMQVMLSGLALMSSVRPEGHCCVSAIQRCCRCAD